LLKFVILLHMQIKLNEKVVPVSKHHAIKAEDKWSRFTFRPFQRRKPLDREMIKDQSEENYN